MTIDANGALHATNGRYTNKDNTAAPDGLLQPTRTETAKDALRKVLEDARTATIAARTELLEAVIVDNVPDAAAVSFVYDNDWHGKTRMDLVLNHAGEIVWDFNDGMDLSSADWQLVGYTQGQVEELDKFDVLNDVMPRDDDNELAARIRELRPGTHRGPRVMLIGTDQ